MSNHIIMYLKFSIFAWPEFSLVKRFNSFIKSFDLPNQLLYCRIHKHADDVQLHLSSPVLSITANVIRLNDDLHRIYHWAKANGLRLKLHKSKCMVIHRRTLDFNIGFHILMNGEKVKIV